MNVMMVFDAVIIGIGAYMISAAVQMKHSGEISATILAKEDHGRCTDKKGFIDFIYKKEAGFGILTAVIGAVGLVGDLITLPRAVGVAGMLVFLAAFVWFQSEMKKAKAQFLRK